jgi:hypothetical protein
MSLLVLRGVWFVNEAVEICIPKRGVFERSAIQGLNPSLEF